MSISSSSRGLVVGDRLRLTILVTNLDRGGAETQAVRLAVGLARRAWDVRMVSMLEPRDFTDELTAAGIPIVGLGVEGGMSIFAVVKRMFGELRRERPHVLLTFTYHANILGKVVGRLCGVPVVSSIRNEHFGGRVRDKIESLTSSLASLTTTNSSLVADALVARGVAKRGGLQVVPNALASRKDTLSEEHRSNLRSELGGEGFLWLSVGRFEAAKDMPNLLEAFATTAKEHPDAHLALVGYGSLADFIAERVAKHPNANRIRILGRRHDVASLLEAADAFVLSSAWEGQPNTLLEALAAGLPVATTLVGGVGELIVDGVGGMTAPPGDAGALAKAMNRVMTMTNEERNVMAGRGREQVLARHDPGVVLDLWESLLREVARV